MASLPTSFRPPTVRVYATKGVAAEAGKSKEAKGLLDFILGGLTKQDQFYETDPILEKVEDKNGGGGTTGTTSGRKNTVVIPQTTKKNGTTGFGGLFAKK